MKLKKWSNRSRNRPSNLFRGPVRIAAFCLLLLFLLACRRESEPRRIKLAEEVTSDQTYSSTLYVEPRERRSIAVLFFRNLTGDRSLQWLQKGLAEMFIRTLSQSRFLAVLSTERVQELLKRMDRPSDEINMDLALSVGREARLQAVVLGDIHTTAEGLRIDVRLLDPVESRVLREESVEGGGLENIFSMVDRLANKIREDLHFAFAGDEMSRSVADLSTSSIEAWRCYMAGVEHMFQVLLPEAIEQFERAVELDSNFVAAHLKLCTLRFGLGDLQLSEELYRRCCDLQQRATPAELYQLGMLKTMLERDTRAAIVYTLEWLQDNPLDRDARFNLAGIYYSQNRFDLAIEQYQKLLEIDPGHKIAYNMLGYCHARLGNYREAISTLKTYQELAPDEPNPYDSLGDLYRYRGDYRKAQKQYRRAMEINDQFPYAAFHLGHVYLDKGDFNGAISFFHELADRFPDNELKGAALVRAASAHWALGELDQAESLYLRAAEELDNPYLAYIYLNDLYGEAGDSARAGEQRRTFYRDLVDHFRSDSTAYLTLALYSYWIDGFEDQTVAHLEEALQNEPERVAAMWMRYYITLLRLKIEPLPPQGPPPEMVRSFEGLVDEAQDNIYSYLTWKGFATFNRAAVDGHEAAAAMYRSLIDRCRGREQFAPERILRLFLSDLHDRCGDPARAAAERRATGVADERLWRVLGSFENKNGFARRYAPEKRIGLDNKVRTRSGMRAWIPLEDGINDGFIDLKSALGDPYWAVGYGQIALYSPDRREVQIRTGSNEAVKIWVNGAEVWRHNEWREAVFDADVASAVLSAGRNEILVKVCNRLGNWGFYLRVTDDQGRGMTDLEFAAPDGEPVAYSR